MKLQDRLIALSELIGADIKTLNTKTGNLNTLQTTVKTSLVAAINELFLLIGDGGGGAGIDDSLASSTTMTYSIDKILAVANQVKQDILGGVPNAAYDTLKEIADYIATDQTAASNIVTALGMRVRVDSAQAFTNEQKLQARANIGAFGTEEIGNPDTDFVTAYNTAKG